MSNEAVSQSASGPAGKRCKRSVHGRRATLAGAPSLRPESQRSAQLAQLAPLGLPRPAHPLAAAAATAAACRPRCGAANSISLLPCLSGGWTCCWTATASLRRSAMCSASRSTSWRSGERGCGGAWRLRTVLRSAARSSPCCREWCGGSMCLQHRPKWGPYRASKRSPFTMLFCCRLEELAAKEEERHETLLCVNRLWEELNASIGFIQDR